MLFHRMTPLRAASALLALVLLGAHLLRWGGMLVVPLALAALALPFLRARWAGRTLRAVLGLGCLEWLRTSWVLAAERQAAGAPFLRMLAILLTVGAFTGWAAWLAGRQRERS